MDSEPNESENEIMVSKCAEWFPSFELNRAALSNARVCFRTSTVDRLPYIGALPDLKTMRDQARSFRSGTDLTKAVPNQTLPGVFVNLGHGSRGAISCPLGGEIIARLINGEDLNELAPALKVVTPERLTHRLPLLIRHN
jgi:tRNA 5-methylaminomethyl-2-thiouridine biosynthesis bifunctional protein